MALTVAEVTVLNNGQKRKKGKKSKILRGPSLILCQENPPKFTCHWRLLEEFSGSWPAVCNGGQNQRLVCNLMEANKTFYLVFSTEALRRCLKTITENTD